MLSQMGLSCHLTGLSADSEDWGCLAGAGLILHPSASAPGLHAERPWEGDRSAENYGEGPGQASPPGHDGSGTQCQPQGQRAGQGAEQLAASRRHR